MRYTGESKKLDAVPTRILGDLGVLLHIYDPRTRVSQSYLVLVVL